MKYSVLYILYKPVNEVWGFLELRTSLILYYSIPLCIILYTVNVYLGIALWVHTLN